MLIRRIDPLYVERVEETEFDLGALLQGRGIAASRGQWRVLRSDTDSATELSDPELDALRRLSGKLWVEREQAAELVGDTMLTRFLAEGLVLSWDEQQAADPSLSWWHALSAVAYRATRWRDVDASSLGASGEARTVVSLVAEFGHPPDEFFLRPDSDLRLPLPNPAGGQLQALAERRVTCRNFARNEALSLEILSGCLHYTFGSHGQLAMAPGAIALKKNSPSGGGLHPIEAYVLARSVHGVQAGLYHYNVRAHSLDRLKSMSAGEAEALAFKAVAGQTWFVDAPALMFLVARFARSQWKYRNHPKIFRVLLLDAGHLSQNLYLAATQHGLGAFITAAINEIPIEEALGLDPMQQGVLAICGIGHRAAERTTVELDPACAVWPVAP